MCVINYTKNRPICILLGMNSSDVLSNTFAINQITPGLIALVALGLLSLILFCLFIYEHRRVSKLLRGKGSMSIEESILELAKELDNLIEFREQSEEYLKLVEMRLRRSIQTIETKRFNPFKGTGAGGNQSFASAFLNENGDGLVLSSLYSSDRMSVYAKPVEKFASEFELSEEEQDALEHAKTEVAIK